MKKLSAFVFVLCMLVSFSSFAEEISNPHPDLKLTIKSCKASGKTVTIECMLINESDIDANLYLYGGGNSSLSAVVYDDQGNSYENVTVSLGGGKIGKVTSGVLPSEVPVKMRIDIEGVGELVESFARINLMVVCEDLKIQMGKQYFKINKLKIDRG